MASPGPGPSAVSSGPVPSPPHSPMGREQVKLGTTRPLLAPRTGQGHCDALRAPLQPRPYLYLLVLLLGHIRHPLQHLLGLVILGRVLAPPEPHLAGQRVLGAAPWGHGDSVRGSQDTWGTPCGARVTSQPLPGRAKAPSPPTYLRQQLPRWRGRLRPGGAGSAGRSRCCTTLRNDLLASGASPGWGSHARPGSAKEGTETSVKHLLTGTLTMEWDGDLREMRGSGRSPESTACLG